MVELLHIELKADEKIIKESLCRIGVANKKEKILYPSCYLYNNNSTFYLVHFKQLFTLTRDKGYNNISEDDLIRRNAIAFCLKEWGLIDVNDEDINPYNKFVFVLPFSEKQNWKIFHKFNTMMIS